MNWKWAVNRTGHGAVLIYNFKCRRDHDEKRKKMKSYVICIGIFLITLAGEGSMFDSFYSAAPVCGPTRASVMMDDRYKLHRYQDMEGTRWELHDLVEDRGETNDIAGAVPEEVSRLKRQLDEWKSGCEEDLLGLTDK